MTTYLGTNKLGKSFTTSSYKSFKKKSGVLGKPSRPPFDPPDPTATPTPIDIERDIIRRMQEGSVFSPKRIVDGIDLGPLKAGLENEPGGYVGDVKFRTSSTIDPSLQVPFPDKTGEATKSQSDAYFPGSLEGFGKTARNVASTYGLPSGDSYTDFLADYIQQGLFATSLRQAIAGMSVGDKNALVGDPLEIASNFITGSGQQFTINDLKLLFSAFGNTTAPAGPQGYLKGLFDIDVSGAGTQGVPKASDINAFINRIAGLLTPAYGTYGVFLAKFLGQKIQEYYDRIAGQQGGPTQAGLGEFLKGVL